MYKRQREGRPSERETLVSRLIDRPIRPLFAKGFQNETQVLATVISYDGENDPDIVAMIAVSASLTLSGVPFMGPIAAARVGYINNEYILNPTKEQLDENCKLDLVVAGTDSAVLMVESEAKELSEEVMLGAVSFGQESFKPVTKAIIQLAEKAAKEPRELEEIDLSNLQETVGKMVREKLLSAYKEGDKQKRSNKITEIKSDLISELVNEDNPDIIELSLIHI